MPLYFILERFNEKPGLIASINSAANERVKNVVKIAKEGVSCLGTNKKKAPDGF